MTNTDPESWFLASQALDHHEAVAVLAAALPEMIMDGFREVGLEDSKKSVADDLAATLAREGYALVRLTPQRHERTEDLTPFLSRKED